MTEPLSAPSPDVTAPKRHRSLWHDPDLTKLWVGQVISTVGSRFTGLATQIVAVVTLGASPAQIGVLAAVNAVPPLLVGLGAGVWVDRHRRRPTLIVADIGRALLLATIPVAALTGRLSIGQIDVIGFLTGVLGVFFDFGLPSLLAQSHRHGSACRG
jgi:MFS family permease